MDKENQGGGGGGDVVQCALFHFGEQKPCTLVDSVEKSLSSRAIATMSLAYLAPSSAAPSVCRFFQRGSECLTCNAGNGKLHFKPSETHNVSQFISCSIEKKFKLKSARHVPFPLPLYAEGKEWSGALNDLVSIAGFIRAQHLGEREQLDDHPPCSVGRGRY